MPGLIRLNARRRFAGRQTENHVANAEGRPPESANQARVRLWGRITSGERRMLGPERGTPFLRALLLYLA